MAEILSVKLVGIAGFSKGREFVIEEGGRAVIGRSRSCDFNLSEPEDTEKAHAAKDEHFHTVSRRHVTIEFEGPKSLFITDTSMHGTFLNGNPIEGRDQILGLRKGPMELRLGTNETFRLELLRREANAQPRITIKRRDD